MTRDHDLGLAFLRLAAAHPDRPAIGAGPARISYGQMHEITLLMALHMQRLGIGQDSIVAARVASSAAFFPEAGLGMAGLFPLSAPALIARYPAALFHRARPPRADRAQPRPRRLAGR